MKLADAEHIVLKHRDQLHNFCASPGLESSGHEFKGNDRLLLPRQELAKYSDELASFLFFYTLGGNRESKHKYNIKTRVSQNAFIIKFLH